MKLLKTIPVYNKKGQKLTSLTEGDFKAIKEELVDERFFMVEGAFVIVKNKFFRPEHLVKQQRFCIYGTQVTNYKLPNVAYKTVLFVLESPHKHEFNYENNFTGRSPLYGSFQTFKDHFSLLMEKISTVKEQAYEVIIYNPVPFQTSLHYLVRKNVKEQTRFNFWLYGWWNMKYHKEFENYLSQNKFDYYLNASTRSYKSIISFKLSSLIRTEYQVYHPSSGFWNRQIPKFGIKKIVHLDDSHELFQTEHKPNTTFLDQSIF